MPELASRLVRCRCIATHLVRTAPAGASMPVTAATGTGQNSNIRIMAIAALCLNAMRIHCGREESNMDRASQRSEWLHSVTGRPLVAYTARSTHALDVCVERILASKSAFTRSSRAALATASADSRYARTLPLLRLIWLEAVRLRALR